MARAGRLQGERGPGVLQACFAREKGEMHNRPSLETSFADPIIAVPTKTWICTWPQALSFHSSSCLLLGGTDPQQMGVIFQDLGICLAFTAGM